MKANNRAFRDLIVSTRRYARILIVLAILAVQALTANGQGKVAVGAGNSGAVVMPGVGTIGGTPSANAAYGVIGSAQSSINLSNLVPVPVGVYGISSSAGQQGLGVGVLGDGATTGVGVLGINAKYGGQFGGVISKIGVLATSSLSSVTNELPAKCSIAIFANAGAVQTCHRLPTNRISVSTRPRET